MRANVKFNWIQVQFTVTFLLRHLKSADKVHLFAKTLFLLLECTVRIFFLIHFSLKKNKLQKL